MKTWMCYDKDGNFTGRTLHGPNKEFAEKHGNGVGIIEGRYSYKFKVDMETMEVIPINLESLSPSNS